jgi:hypothetical protein
MIAVRQLVHRLPRRVGGEPRPGFRRDQREVGGREDALPRIARRIAAGLQLLKVRDLGDVHLGGEVPAGGRAQPFAGPQRAAGQRPRAFERGFSALPEQHLEPLRPNLEHDPERLVTKAVGWHALMVTKFSITGGKQPELRSTQSACDANFW